MNPPDAETVAPPPSPPATHVHEPSHPPMPAAWRIGLLGVVVGLTVVAHYSQTALGSKGTALIGAFTFFILAAAFSSNLRAVNWRTIAWGIALQLTLILLVLKCQWTIGDQTYSVYAFFDRIGDGVKAFIGYSDKGAKFVFGDLSTMVTEDIALKPGKEVLFIFAFKALLLILFVSAFFTVLFHFGILQWAVRILAKIMVYLMGTSGAETLSVSANVFMGQTEAPLIVKPYVPRMTNSELFTLMVSGMAHISGGMMAVYINYGADPVAVITTCIMACPCSLYLAKLMLPEMGRPETMGDAPVTTDKSPYVNAVDAAAAGTGDGLRLALNVAAMLIVFVAFVALFDGLLGQIKPMLLSCGVSPASLQNWPDNLSLQTIFGWLFKPVAMLMGVEGPDQETVGGLLGSKLSINEHYAYLDAKTRHLLDIKDKVGAIIPGSMLKRSQILAAFALTGFANFSSVGIQLGGIGALAPERRHDLVRLGGKALFAGFLATLLNAAIAGLFVEVK